MNEYMRMADRMYDLDNQIEQFKKKNEELKNQVKELAKDLAIHCQDTQKVIDEYEKENRLLGERCNQLLKDKGDLTDQIADIKANCDLAIEGRDIKIKELEQQIEQIQDAKCTSCTDLGGLQLKITELEKENAKLKNKIEHRNCVDCSNHHSNIKLLKAKKLLKQFLEAKNGEDTYKAEWDAEQFLKEISE